MRRDSEKHAIKADAAPGHEGRSPPVADFLGTEQIYETLIATLDKQKTVVPLHAWGDQQCNSRDLYEQVPRGKVW